MSLLKRLLLGAESWNARIANVDPRVQHIVTVTLIGFVLFLSFLNSYSYLDPEAPFYLWANLRHMPLLLNVFDIGANDYGIFRARELSYFFNILDAHFIQWSSWLGLTHFASTVHFAFVLMVVASFFRLSKQHLPLAWHQNLFLALILLCSPVVFLTGFFFRTSKIMTAVFAFYLVWEFYLTFSHVQRDVSKGRLVGVGGTSLALMLVDEQGVFLSALFGLLCLLFFSTLRRRVWAHFAGSIFCAALFYFAYRFAMTAPPLDPSLQEPFILNGKDLRIAWAQFGVGWDITLDWVEYFFGSRALFAGVAASALFLAVQPFGGRAGWSWARAAPLLAALITFVAFFVAHTLMVSRHDLLPLQAVRRVYYALPLHVLLLPITAFVVTALLKQRRVSSSMVSVLLFLVLISSAVSLPGHIRIRRVGFEQRMGRPYYASGQGMMHCVSSGAVDRAAMPPIDLAACFLLRGGEDFRPAASNGALGKAVQSSDKR